MVFVPGVTGSVLVDGATGENLWGAARRFFRPRDRGHSNALSVLPEVVARDTVEATEVLLEIRLLGYRKQVYGPLVRALEERGLRLGDLDYPEPGDELFLFPYDWRRSTVHTAQELDRRLTALSAALGVDGFRLICQSNGGRVCRWVRRYGGLSLEQALEAAARPPSPYEISGLVLVGVAGGGALRQLHELDRGRRYIPGVGRFMGPETLFTLRPLLEELPQERDDLFLDAAGRPVELDLFDASTWTSLGWSIFDPAVEARLSRVLAADPAARRVFGARADRVSYLEGQLEQARDLHRALVRPMADSPDTPICLLENLSDPATPYRAQVIGAGTESELVFGSDAGVADGGLAAGLRERLLGIGDGHATAGSQRRLADEESRSLVHVGEIEGGHFDAIVGEATHRAIWECLDLLGTTP